MSCVSGEPLNISQYFKRARRLNLFLLEVFVERIELFEIFRRDGNPTPISHEEARVRVKFMDLPCIEIFRGDAPEFKPCPRPDPEKMFTRHNPSKDTLAMETESTESTSEESIDEVFDVRESSNGVYSVRASHEPSKCKVRGCCLPSYKLESCGPGRRGSKDTKVRALGGGIKVSTEETPRTRSSCADDSEVEEVFRSDAFNRDPSCDDYSNSSNYPVEGSEASMGPGVEFNVASSYLFIHQPIQLLHMIQRYPMTITVYFLTSLCPGIVGYAQIPLSDGFFESIEQAVRESMPTIGRMRKVLPIKTPSCKVVGKIKVTFGLTCFGEEAWTKLISPEPNPNQCPGKGEAVEKTIVYTSSDRVRRQARRDVQRKPAIVCGIEHVDMPDEKYHDPCDDMIPTQKIPGFNCVPVTHAYIQGGVHLTEEALMCTPLSTSTSRTSFHSLPRTLSLPLPECPSLTRVCGGEEALLHLFNRAEEFVQEMEADPCGPMTEEEALLEELLETPLAVPLPLTPWATVHKAVCSHFPKRCQHFSLYYPGRGFAKDPDIAFAVGYSELT